MIQTYLNKKKLAIQLRRFYLTHDRCAILAPLIGCSKEEFKTYIDNKLIEEMEPTNFGIVWELDHIVPIHLFQEDFEKAWNFQNIIPMRKQDNKNKGASVHFSLIYLKSQPISEIREYLINKCMEEIKKYDKYLI